MISKWSHLTRERRPQVSLPLSGFCFSCWYKCINGGNFHATSRHLLTSQRHDELIHRQRFEKHLVGITKDTHYTDCSASLEFVKPSTRSLASIYVVVTYTEYIKWVKEVCFWKDMSQKLWPNSAWYPFDVEYARSGEFEYRSDWNI